jgi:hypothetical protein
MEAALSILMLLWWGRSEDCHGRSGHEARQGRPPHTYGTGPSTPGSLCTCRYAHLDLTSTQGETRYY